MEVKLPLDERILKFADEHNLYILGQYGRDCKAREVKNYTISTDRRIVLGRINPDCTYEQFLEKIANSAIFEAERLYNLNDELEQDYEDMCGNFATLKEATNDI